MPLSLAALWARRYAADFLALRCFASVPLSLAVVAAASLRRSSSGSGKGQASLAEGLDLRGRFLRTTAGSSSKVFCAGSFWVLLVPSAFSADASSASTSTFAFHAAFFAFLTFFLGAAAGAVRSNHSPSDSVASVFFSIFSLFLLLLLVAVSALSSSVLPAFARVRFLGFEVFVGSVSGKVFGFDLALALDFALAFSLFSPSAFALALLLAWAGRPRCFGAAFPDSLFCSAGDRLGSDSTTGGLACVPSSTLGCCSCCFAGTTPELEVVTSTSPDPEAGRTGSACAANFFAGITSSFLIGLACKQYKQVDMVYYGIQTAKRGRHQ